VLVKMDNGFTLKLDAQTLSVGLAETSQTSRAGLPAREPQHA
jgi:hypothetical protein